MHWTTGKLLRHFAVACTALASMVVGSSAAVAAGFTAQGIMPGDPDPNSIKLGDVEAAIRPRMFYKNTDTLTGGEQEAWALGGFADFRLPPCAAAFTGRGNFEDLQNDEQHFHYAVCKRTLQVFQQPSLLEIRQQCSHILTRRCFFTDAGQPRECSIPNLNDQVRVCGKNAD